jgi:hypothetical protein
MSETPEAIVKNLCDRWRTIDWKLTSCEQECDAVNTFLACNFAYYKYVFLDAMHVKKIIKTMMMCAMIWFMVHRNYDISLIVTVIIVLMAINCLLALKTASSAKKEFDMSVRRLSSQIDVLSQTTNSLSDNHDTKEH